VSHLTYAAVLLACLLGAAWLEIALHTRVFRRWRRLLLTVVPVLVVFVAWDAYAIGRGQWTFAPRYITGLRLGRLPVEELAFFVVIPICSVLAFEAVRRVRGWPAGDEPELSDRNHETDSAAP
jgi:lycopene cyclase domain-containing protein